MNVDFTDDADIQHVHKLVLVGCDWQLNTETELQVLNRDIQC